MARSHREFVRFGLGLPSFIRDRLVRYTVAVCFGLDLLADLLGVARGTAASAVVVRSTAGALAGLLRVVLGVVVSVVVVCSAGEVLTRTSRLRVFRGALVSVVAILYGVDVLSMAKSTQSSFLATATMARLLPFRSFNRANIADHLGLLPTSRQAASTRAHRKSPEPSLVIFRSLDFLPPLCLTAGASPA